MSGATMTTLIDDLDLAQHLGGRGGDTRSTRDRRQIARLRLQYQRGDLSASDGAYQGLGCPVWPDEPADFSGPLAGMLAGLNHCTTRYLATVPCDSPNFPLDL